VLRHVGDPVIPRGLTFEDQSFTINPIRGDKEIRSEFQPHFQAEFWPAYLKECDMRFVPPPTDGREEAPGAQPKPNDSDEE